MLNFDALPRVQKREATSCFSPPCPFVLPLRPMYGPLGPSSWAPIRTTRSMAEFLVQFTPADEFLGGVGPAEVMEPCIGPMAGLLRERALDSNCWNCFGMAKFWSKVTAISHRFSVFWCPLQVHARQADPLMRKGTAAMLHDGQKIWRMKSISWFCCNFHQFPSISPYFPIFPFFGNLKESLTHESLTHSYNTRPTLQTGRNVDAFGATKSRKKLQGNLASFTTSHAIAMGTPYFPSKHRYAYRAFASRSLVLLWMWVCL